MKTQNFIVKSIYKKVLMFIISLVSLVLSDNFRAKNYNNSSIRSFLVHFPLNFPFLQFSTLKEN